MTANWQPTNDSSSQLNMLNLVIVDETLFIDVHVLRAQMPRLCYVFHSKSLYILQPTMFN